MINHHSITYLVSFFLSYSFLFSFLTCFPFIYIFSNPAPAIFTLPITAFIMSCSGKDLSIGFYFYDRSRPWKYWTMVLAALPFFNPPGTNFILNLFSFIALYGAHMGTKNSGLSYGWMFPTNL